MKRSRSFLTAYFCTAVVCGGILWLMMILWQPTESEELRAQAAGDPTFSQVIRENDEGKTCVLFYCSLRDKAPRSFFLLTYDRRAEQVTVQAVDETLKGSYRGEELPLPALHSLFGVRSVKSGASQALGCEISTAVYADREGVLTLLEQMGSFDVVLRKDTEYTEVYTGRKFLLSAGRQTLSPTAAAGLLASLESSGDREGAATVITCLLQQRGADAVESGLFLSTLYGICETDMTAVQAKLAAPILQRLAQKENAVVLGQTVSKP